ncbi:18115_t:CDS:2, partial [Entrophospora sp. SA101]
MQCYGLICVSPDSQEKPIPLQNVKVEANVVDMIAEEDKNIEALYKFPIYEAAAICDFEAEIDGKYKIKGYGDESDDNKEARDKILSSSSISLSLIGGGVGNDEQTGESGILVT